MNDLTLTQSSPRKRLDSLTGLRWWAAFGVFLYHMNIFAPIPLSSFFDYGNYGVMFFFVLSGFVLTWSWSASTSLKQNYQNRIARIWPLTFVTLLMAIPVFYSFNPEPSQWWVKPFDLPILLLSVIVIQGWWLNPVILFSGNPASWSLTVEFFFYFLHPFMMKNGFRKSKMWAWSLLSLLIAYLVIYKFICSTMLTGLCWQLPLPFQRLPEFILGCLLGLLAINGVRLRISPIFFIAAIFIFLAFMVKGPQVLGVAIAPQTFSFWGNEVILALIALLVYSYATNDIYGKKSLLKANFLQKLGELSFAFYLVHATVMYAAVNLWGQLGLSWKNVIVYPPLLVVGILIAWVLNKYIEKPFNIWIRSMRIFPQNSKRMSH